MRPPTLAPPTSAGRRVRHRLAPVRRCHCRPGTKCPAWSAAWSTPKAKSCPGDLAPVRSVAAQARSAACRSRPTTLARASAVSTSIACLSNRTSSESLSQKQPQAAQPAHTCGKPPSFRITKAGMPGGGRPNIPGMAAAVEDSRTERIMLREVGRVGADGVDEFEIGGPARALLAARAGWHRHRLLCRGRWRRRVLGRQGNHPGRGFVEAAFAVPGGEVSSEPGPEHVVVCARVAAAAHVSSIRVERAAAHSGEGEPAASYRLRRATRGHSVAVGWATRVPAAM
jgi:hypothetical protein